MNSVNKTKGIIKKTPLMNILQKKVELKKQLILLKKSKLDTEKQEKLVEEIAEIDSYLSNHKIQK